MTNQEQQQSEALYLYFKEMVLDVLKQHQDKDLSTTKQRARIASDLAKQLLEASRG